MMGRSLVVLCSGILLFMLMLNQMHKTVGSSDGEDSPVPKMKSRFAVPVVKFLICQS